MASTSFYDRINQQIVDVKADGLYKSERIIASAQQTAIEVNHAKVINFCANNYLGLANHPELIKAA